MRLIAIDKFIKRIQNIRYSGVKEFKISTNEAVDIMMELLQLISTEDHLITSSEIKEILRQQRQIDKTEVITGGKF